MNVQGILRGKKNITETWQGRIKIKIVFLCNIYLLSLILLGGQLTLSTMTQHAGVHAHVSVLFLDRKSLSESEAATHWQQRPFVSAKLQLTRMALLACVWPQGLKPRDFPRSMQPGRATHHLLNKDALPHSHRRQVEEHISLSNYIKKGQDERRWMSLTNVSLLRSCLPLFSPPGKPMILRPEEILEKYKCKSSASQQFHLGECWAVS